MALNIVCVNYTFDRPITNPNTLLDRYETLVGWAEGLRSAGAQVLVVQRFGANTERTRNGISYRFVYDPALKNGSVCDWAARVNATVVEAQPNVVHINGLQFARQAWQLKRMLTAQAKGARIPLLLQDHKNPVPRRWIERWTLGRALRRMDAVSFVSRDQAKPWLDAGLLQDKQPIVELMEGSSHFSLKSQATARARTGLTGDPLCLWVGQLNANKDPLTVLSGFAKALRSLPGARLAMVYGSEALLPAVHKWLADNPTTSSYVQLLGRRPHAELEDIYNSADLFLLGSHLEGSGYAVLEALSCGVTPIVTSIPPFRVLTGGGTIGGLWPNGDADALARVMTSRYSVLHPGTRQDVRAFFDANFRWNVTGERALHAYQTLLNA